MIKGISVNGKHSYYSFGLRMLKRTIGSAPKDDHTERVPYSNVTYNFDSIYGSPSYGERTLSYRFEFMDHHTGISEERLMNIISWLHWSDRLDLYDDMLPDYHFEVREPSVSWSEDHGVYAFDVTFKANPGIKPNPNMLKYNSGNVTIPDVDEDGLVTAADSSAILSAYGNLATGKDSGLTDKQKRAADADRNGAIDAVDASMVLAFYGRLSTGVYKDMTVEQAWAAYLNEFFNSGGEVY
ncbi:MAG: hypothetical protein IJ874_09150 [Ruminococcus sp.]|nr:hypothetical protein [Ruminococcus sp.]